MSRIRTFVTKIFVVTSLALGGIPRIVTLLELLQSPSVARVAITHRRRPDYADLLSPVDQDELRRAAARLPRKDRAGITYLRVDAA